VSPSLRTKVAIARVRKAIAQLQLTRITIAHTMMDHADRALDWQTVERCRRRARSAYVAIVKMLPKLYLTPVQAARLEQRLTALKARLDAAQIKPFN
jgi:hypothetical protein